MYVSWAKADAFSCSLSGKQLGGGCTEGKDVSWNTLSIRVSSQVWECHKHRQPDFSPGPKAATHKKATVFRTSETARSDKHLEIKVIFLHLWKIPFHFPNKKKEQPKQASPKREGTNPALLVTNICTLASCKEFWNPELLHSQKEINSTNNL